MSDVYYHNNIDLIQRLDFIYANNWFPNRDATIVIIVIFQVFRDNVKLGHKNYFCHTCITLDMIEFLLEFEPYCC